MRQGNKKVEDKSDYCAAHPLSGGILELHNNLNNTHVHILVLEKHVQTEPRRGDFLFFHECLKLWLDSGL